MTFYSGCQIATPEKALVDTLYYRSHLPVPDELELERLDRDILIEAVKKFPSTVNRKLTSLLEWDL